MKKIRKRKEEIVEALKKTICSKGGFLEANFNFINSREKKIIAL